MVFSFRIEIKWREKKLSSCSNLPAVVTTTKEKERERRGAQKERKDMRHEKRQGKGKNETRGRQLETGSCFAP
jgi:hypothetical protein